MDKLQAGLAIIGALSTVFTALHVVLPNVTWLQRMGMALRQFGPKQPEAKS